MPDAYNEGDIVQLKSGGPSMTVEETLDDGKYRCVWFKGASRELGVFKENTLKTYVPPVVND